MDGQEVELRGILETISNRFYSGGWGFGTLSTDKGVVKITGTLEGHVAGSSLIVRGSYKSTTYGLQLDCSSIVVDSVSGDMNVIRSWARKHCAEHEFDIVTLCRHLDDSERWPILADEDRILSEGISKEAAAAIASGAKAYLWLIAAKKGLMEKGFTDREAEKMCTIYGERVMTVLEEDPYSIVIERIVPFGRIDVVVDGRISRADPKRMQAAVVQALSGALRNGHTAVDPKGVRQEAAQMAGVYPDAVERAGLPTRAVRTFDGKLQLRASAYAEADIAAWVMEAVRREA